MTQNNVIKIKEVLNNYFHSNLVNKIITILSTIDSTERTDILSEHFKDDWKYIASIFWKERKSLPDLPCFYYFYFSAKKLKQELDLKEYENSDILMGNPDGLTPVGCFNFERHGYVYESAY